MSRDGFGRIRETPPTFGRTLATNEREGRGPGESGVISSTLLTLLALPVLYDLAGTVLAVQALSGVDCVSGALGERRGVRAKGRVAGRLQHLRRPAAHRPAT